MHLVEKIFDEGWRNRDRILNIKVRILESRHFREGLCVVNNLIEKDRLFFSTFYQHRKYDFDNTFMCLNIFLPFWNYFLAFFIPKTVEDDRESCSILNHQSKDMIHNNPLEINSSFFRVALFLIFQL